MNDPIHLPIVRGPDASHARAPSGDLPLRLQHRRPERVPGNRRLVIREERKNFPKVIVQSGPISLSIKKHVVNPTAHTGITWNNQK